MLPRISEIADRLQMTGVARVLLPEFDINKKNHTVFDGNLIYVVTTSIEQLVQVDGIGFAEASQIKAAFELTK